MSTDTNRAAPSTPRSSTLNQDPNKVSQPSQSATPPPTPPTPEQPQQGQQPPRP
jgi:hypothetical protein